MIHTGIGHDLHRLSRKRSFLLAGVKIPAKKGELGHSDGDVLAHAVIDALLGAAGIGDIGELFPASDPAFQGADSMSLLRIAFELVSKAGWRIINIDSVVICEKPVILPFRTEICAALADALEIAPEAVFVKGKTAEGTGPAGKGKTVEAFVVCLLERD